MPSQPKRLCYAAYLSFGTIVYIRPPYVHSVVLPILPAPIKCVFLLDTQNIQPEINHKAITAPMIIPLSLNIATLFPLAAMRPRRLADPFRDVLIEENVSEVLSMTSCCLALS